MPVTDLYVRFSPLNEAQLALLEDSLDLDLYDYPLDYEVITDGDYYPQPGKAAEDMPDFYTTVPVSFAFPAGVPYTILEELHFPHNDVILEALAESIAAGGHYSGVHLNSTLQVLMTNLDNGAQVVNTNSCGCEPNPFDLQCIPPDPTCGGGDPGWGGGGGGGGNPGPPSFPPGITNPGSTQPAGNIRVFDTQLGAQPLGNVRVVAKRGLRRSRTYTNQQGVFSHPLHMPGRSKLLLRYRNPDVSVRPLRNRFRVRLSLLVVRQVMGRYDLPLNNIQFTVTRNNNRASKSFENWLAAHAIYSYNYFAQQAQVDDIKRMTGHRLCIYLHKNSDEDNRGPEAEVTLQNYIFKSRGAVDWLIEVGKLTMYLVNQNYLGAILQVFENILSTQKPDIVFKYNTLFENLSSNEVNQQYFAAYTKVGTFKAINDNPNSTVRWKSYFKVNDKFFDVNLGYAGMMLKILLKELKILKFLYEHDRWTVEGTNGYISWSSVINLSVTFVNGLFQMVAAPDFEFYSKVNGFSEYYGHFLSHRKYGGSADAILDQQRKRVFSLGNESSHLRYLENWNPSETGDINLMQKVGLFHDLNDVNSAALETISGRTQTGLDQVQDVKPASMQKSIAGTMPFLIHSPQIWWHTRANIQVRYPAQEQLILSLFTIYE
ncbi:MAG: hypothetical protein ACK4E8_11460 [Lacibacter sp.]